MNKKHLISLLLAGILALACTACTAPQADHPSAAPPEVPAVLVIRYLMEQASTANPDLPQLTLYTSAGETFDTYCGLYGIPREKVVEGAALVPSGVEAREAAIFFMESEEAALEAQTAFDLYLKSRQASFTGYAPEQEALLKTASTSTCGHWAMLLCTGSAGASAAISAKQFIQQMGDPPFTGGSSGLQAQYTLTADDTGTPIFVDENGDELFLQPGKQPMPLFDTSPLVSAWTSGDGSALTDQEKELLSVCREAMAQLREDMSPYEKELALHDWLVDWTDYNKDTLDPLQPAALEDTSPYGALVKRKGNCMGYANSFQLLMDLAGIPCQTVPGAVLHCTGDHAWNLVELDGAWYAVDVTWNDPYGAAEALAGDKARLTERQHRYFNVTSEYLRETGHLWDRRSVPEAAGTACAWKEAK